MNTKNLPEASLYTSLAEYFRDARMLKGLGLPAIADVTGFHTSNLSRIERSVHQPTLDTLDRLSVADAFGCPWWSEADNLVFLRALAYHIVPVPRYAPRNTEWWPANMTTAVSTARAIAHDVTLAQSAHWPVVVQLWPAMGLPGWRPPSDSAEVSPPSLTRPIWLWGAWKWAQGLHKGSDGTPAENRINVITEVLGAILETVDAWRTRKAADDTPVMPTDPDFRATSKAWPNLTSAHRRLVRELTEALACS